MDKRIRSPNYPALSLPDAIERVAALYRAQHTHGAPREAIARGMGYNSPNGASASVASHAKLYNMIWTCYAVWHVANQHSAGDNG